MTEKIWDVFISYKRDPDEAVAFELLAALEQQGIKCWIAPRDIRLAIQMMGNVDLTGSNGWDDAIPFAVESSRAMAIVVSRASMSSKQVKKEIYLADDADIHFIPVLIEDVPLERSFKLHLGRTQWSSCFADSGPARFVSAVRDIAGILGVSEHEHSPSFYPVSHEGDQGDVATDTVLPNRQGPVSDAIQLEVPTPSTATTVCDTKKDQDCVVTENKPPWEYFDLGNMTVGQVLESPESEELAGYIAFYSSEDEGDTELILEQLMTASPSALVKDVVEGYAGFLDADTVGEFSVSDARAWSLGRVIERLANNLSIDAVEGVLNGTHGKTKVLNAFVGCWPDTAPSDDLPDELLNWDYHALGEMKAGEVLAHSEADHIVQGIAMFAQKSGRTVRRYLKEAIPEGLVKDVVKNYQDILDPDVLTSMNVATARDLDLGKVIAQVFVIDDMTEIYNILNETHGRTLLGKAFSGHWPK